MSPLERYAAAENAAMREVMHDNRGVEGLSGSRLTVGMNVRDRDKITRRASKLCAGCGCILPQSGRWNYQGETMCSQRCLDDVRRWNK